MNEQNRLTPEAIAAIKAAGGPQGPMGMVAYIRAEPAPESAEYQRGWNDCCAYIGGLLAKKTPR